MDNIKESFQRVKQDINSLHQEMNFLKTNLIETREKMIEICEIIKKIDKKLQNISRVPSISTSTDRHIISTLSTSTSTDKTSLEPLNSQNLRISTGNQGVPTDRQTDTSTDRQTQNIQEIPEKSIDNAFKILNSLDSIKKDLRLKFKRLTEQELMIFSAVYQLDEEIGYTDYKTLSQRLKLTESSIRDYIGRLIKKGIPVEKRKVNNKNIQLSISKNLKKIASLSTILQLRDL